MNKLRFNLDTLGMCASSLCMIHCLLFPLLLVAMPLLSFSSSETEGAPAGQSAEPSSLRRALLNHADACSEEDCCPATEAAIAGPTNAGCCSSPTDFWIHVGLLAAVAPLGIVAWGAGYRKHRRLGVLFLGLSGVLLLAAALLYGNQLLGGRGEQVMTVAGSICMVSAHMWNRRQCRCCNEMDLTRLVEIEAISPDVQPGSLAEGGAC